MIGTSIRIAPRRLLNEKTCGTVQGLSPADANLKTLFNTLCTQNTANSSLDIGKLWLIQVLEMLPVYYIVRKHDIEFNCPLLTIIF